MGNLGKKLLPQALKSCPKYNKYPNKADSFFLNGPTQASFSFIYTLFKQTIQFSQQINVKNVISIQYTAPGFKPSTSWTWVISHNHQTRAHSYLELTFSRSGLVLSLNVHVKTIIIERKKSMKDWQRNVA